MKKALSLIIVICMFLALTSVCCAEGYDVPHLKKPRMFGPVGFYYAGNFKFVYEGTAKDGRPYEMYNMLVEEGYLMQSFADGAEFVYFSGASSTEWDMTLTDKLGLTDNVFNPLSYGRSSNTLKDYGITAYPTKRLSEGWEKGLTWEFHKADGTVSYANKWHIGVIYEEKWYLFFIEINLNGTDEKQKNLLASDLYRDERCSYQEEVTFPAVKSTAKIIVDGKEVLMEGYNINGYTYFKLRDVAMALKGTPSEFNVEYRPDVKVFINKYGEKYEVPGGMVATMGNREYIPSGGELTISEVSHTTAKRVNTRIFYDRGVLIGIDVVNIGGYNYSTIRQIGMGVDFHVDWDEENKAIIIDTTRYYWE